ncbi:putative polyprotein of retroviral origin [Ixodes scapularis]
MQSTETLFSGGGSSRGTVCAAGFGFALAFGTVLVSLFLLVSVSWNIGQIKAKRQIRAFDSYIKKEVSKILSAQGSPTALEEERVTKRRILFSLIIPSGKKFTTKAFYRSRLLEAVTTASRPGHKKFFSKLDLAKRYWHIPMEEEYKEKTAFSSSSGLYQFKFMPSGLKTAAATFTKLMRKLLEGVPNTYH